MDGLFINYRREDSAPYAGRLYDFLRRAFPDRQVFMDVDAIDPGEDFDSAIRDTIASSSIVIAVIGPNWIGAVDETGGRRIDDPDDYVVLELSLALESGSRVMPVLVGGASMPKTERLPPALRALTRRHAIDISDARFAADADRLKIAVARASDPSAASDGRRSSGSLPPKISADSLALFKTLLWTSFALGVIAVGMLIGRTHDSQTVKLYAVLGVVVIGLDAWFLVSLMRGRNWARMANIAWTITTLPGNFVDLPSQSSREIALNVVSYSLAVWIIRMTFSEPIRQLYRRP